MFNRILQRLRYWLVKTNGYHAETPQHVRPESPVVLSGKAVWIQLLDTGPFEINRISLLFATFQRINQCHVDIRLFSNNHKLLHQEVVDAKNLLDNIAYPLRLPEGFSYRGESYLVIASPDATHKDCVALWAAPDLGGDGLRAIPRLGQDISVITSDTQEGITYPNMALVTVLVRNTREHTVRTYVRPSAQPIKLKESPLALGLIGFGENEKKTLLASIGSSALTLQHLEMSELDRISQYEALLVSATYDVELGHSLARLTRRKKVPLIMAEVDETSASARVRDAWSAYADGLITRHPKFASRLMQVNLEIGLAQAVDVIQSAWKKRQQPKISIVTILSGKANQLRWVIESYFDQTYSGEIEVVYVNDCFGDDAERVIVEEFARNSERQLIPQLSYTILRNDRNLGNCASRNRGVKAASGDIVIIIDADCMLNRQFIAAHVDAHAYFDCEVVIGPCNIETNGEPPLEKLAELERNPTVGFEQAQLQDPLVLDGFLNCITRNFSIKKSAIVEDLFDLDFSYSLAPDSGFGWEDVEMGYRLYQRGLGIKFTEDAFSVHISHSSSVPEAKKPRMSIRNFHKLFIKHPELRDVARRWAVQTLDSLDQWSATVDPTHHENSDLAVLKQRFADAPRSIPQIKTQGRKLRILTYRWHVPHQYELYKSGHHFFLVRGTGSQMSEQWEFGHRPMPANATFIDVKDVRESSFDLALLHFDENVLNYENTNGQIGPEWGATFRYFVEQINLPKVAICHGTPQFYGQYTPGYDKPDLMQVIESARIALVNYVRDIEIVCNSHQAQREWGFHKSRVIWHGFDPIEFLPATYSKGILSPLGPLVKSRPHYRGYYLYQQVFSPEFPKAFLPESLSVPDPDIDYVDNVFAIAKYKNYIDQIRQYSIYFNPTLRSPMPRARCEPMMCGVVTVNANNHDVSMFIQNGVNGFYSNDPQELREQLLFLMRHPEATRKMGAEARKTAINIFNHDRYLSEWSRLLKFVV